jgi:hypothetical protein
VYNAAFVRDAQQTLRMAIAHDRVHGAGGKKNRHCARAEIAKKSNSRRFLPKEIGLNLIELILTVCTLTQPESCEERRLSFVDISSVTQCMKQALPAIAEWAISHPGRRVAKWRCSYSGSEGNSL